MRYRLLGLDIDGTLLDSSGHVTQRNRAAIDAAIEAGVTVAPCTGRAWRESRRVLEVLPQLEHGVFVTGAAICEIATGISVEIATIEPHLAHQIVEFLSPLPEAVLVFRDANVCGHDYLVTGEGELTPNTRWWFETTGANVHFEASVGADDLHHTLRVGLVASGRRVGPLSERIKGRFGEQVLVQSFAAVQMPDPNESVHVLEVFAAGVDKWRGLSWVARQQGIGTEAVAVIGDEINDVAMIRSAGCGIAMANAIDDAKAVAQHVTHSNDESGVAYAIEQMLCGRW